MKYSITHFSVFAFLGLSALLALPAHAQEGFLVGAGLGDSNPNRVRGFDPGGQPTTLDFMAFAAGKWGTNVAAGNLTFDGNGKDSVLAGPGPGTMYGPQVRGFSADAKALPGLNYFAYGTMKYGVNVETGDTNQDELHEPFTAAGAGTVYGPHFRGWHYDGTRVRPNNKVNFFGYQSLRYGGNITARDIDLDGRAELLTGPGPGPVFSAQVRGWNTDGNPITPIAKINFDAFATREYGVNLAGGDVDGDGFGEILTTYGPGPSHAATFRGFNYDGVKVAAIPGYSTTPYTSSYGGRVGAGMVLMYGRDELLTAPGRDPVASASVMAFKYNGQLQAARTFNAFPGYVYGASPTGIQLGF